MNEQTNRELTLSRTFDAPREQVFKAWIDQALVQKWWGPEGFTNSVFRWDAQSGGDIDVVMEDSTGMIEKGKKFPVLGSFREVVEPERIVFTAQAIMDGKAILETLDTVTFEEVDGGKTKMTLHVVVQKATPEAEGPLAGMEMGWRQSLDKLAKVLSV